MSVRLRSRQGGNRSGGRGKKERWAATTLSSRRKCVVYALVIGHAGCSNSDILCALLADQLLGTRCLGRCYVQAYGQKAGSQTESDRRGSNNVAPQISRVEYFAAIEAASSPKPRCCGWWLVGGCHVTCHLRAIVLGLVLGCLWTCKEGTRQGWYAARDGSTDRGQL